MPGLMSGLFEPENNEETSSQNTTTVSGEGETGIEASPSVGIGMSGSYEDADGTEHQWSNDTQVGADFDLDAAIAHSTEIGLSDTDISG